MSTIPDPATTAWVPLAGGSGGAGGSDEVTHQSFEGEYRFLSALAPPASNGDFAFSSAPATGGYIYVTKVDYQQEDLTAKLLQVFKGEVLYIENIENPNEWRSYWVTDILDSGTYWRFSVRIMRNYLSSYVESKRYRLVFSRNSELPTWDYAADARKVLTLGITTTVPQWQNADYIMPNRLVDSGNNASPGYYADFNTLPNVNGWFQMNSTIANRPPGSTGEMWCIQYAPYDSLKRQEAWETFSSPSRRWERYQINSSTWTPWVELTDNMGYKNTGSNLWVTAYPWADLSDAGVGLGGQGYLNLVRMKADRTITAGAFELAAVLTASKYRMCVYADNQPTMGPGALLRESADIDCSTGAGIKQWTGFTALPANTWYWVGVFNPGTTNPTTRMAFGVNPWSPGGDLPVSGRTYVGGGWTWLAGAVTACPSTLVGVAPGLREARDTVATWWKVT